MKASFIVRTTPQLDRLIRKLAKHHSDLPDRFAEAIKILQTDPYNTVHSYAIKKLQGVKAGESHIGCGSSAGVFATTCGTKR
jgi:hypothetical protein